MSSLGLFFSLSVWTLLSAELKGLIFNISPAWALHLNPIYTFTWTFSLEVQLYIYKKVIICSLKHWELRLFTGMQTFRILQECTSTALLSHMQVHVHFTLDSNAQGSCTSANLGVMWSFVCSVTAALWTKRAKDDLLSPAFSVLHSSSNKAAKASTTFSRSDGKKLDFNLFFTNKAVLQHPLEGESVSWAG